MVWCTVVNLFFANSFTTFKRFVPLLFFFGFLVQHQAFSSEITCGCSSMKMGC